MKSKEHGDLAQCMKPFVAQIGAGTTVWTTTTGTRARHKKSAQIVLSALGKEVYVADEKYLDMATALSSSGPAYIFLFIEALIDAGVHTGLAWDMAQEFVIQTLLGSTRTVEKTGRHAAALRNMVTSPGWITTEALFELEKGGFRSLLVEAVAAAHKKVESLSEFSRLDWLLKTRFR